MKALITGGAGFIGSHIVDKLIEKGYSVAIIDNLFSGKKKNINPRAKFYKVDIRDKRLEKIFEREKPGFVFHEAAQIDIRKSVEDPVFDADVNILGTLNLLRNCVKYEIKKFIFASSGGAIYGEENVIPTPEDYSARPISPYGIAKLTAEQYLYYYKQIFGLPYVALRYANVYGPRQDPYGEAGVIAIFTKKLLNGDEVIINGDGRQTRDYVYVDDVVEANVLALESRAIGSFNIGTGIETNVNELFHKLNKIIGTNVLEKYGPVKQGEQRRSCLDSSKIKKLGWQPSYNLNKGLKETVEWFKLSIRSVHAY